VISTINPRGNFSNIVPAGGGTRFICSEGGHAVANATVTGGSGRTYGVPRCPVDNPVPDLNTLADMYAARSGNSRAAELARL